MNAYRVCRGDDMPLTGRIVREKKGVYVVTINFTKSRRHYGDEIVHAASVKHVKKHMAIIYPTLTFGKEKKVAKRNPVARDLRTPKYRPRIVKSKKVYSRKGKKP